MQFDLLNKGTVKTRLQVLITFAACLWFLLLFRQVLHFLPLASMLRINCRNFYLTLLSWTITQGSMVPILSSASSAFVEAGLQVSRMV
jgi:hypothetical protein